MLWVLLSFVLLAAALGVFGYLGLRLYRQARALTAELSTASARMSEISAAMTDLAQPPGPTDSSSQR